MTAGPAKAPADSNGTSHSAASRPAVRLSARLVATTRSTGALRLAAATLGAGVKSTAATPYSLARRTRAAAVRLARSKPRTRPIRVSRGQAGSQVAAAHSSRSNACSSTNWSSRNPCWPGLVRAR